MASYVRFAERDSRFQRIKFIGYDVEDSTFVVGGVIKWQLGNVIPNHPFVCPLFHQRLDGSTRLNLTVGKSLLGMTGAYVIASAFR
eukprot:scaffold3924_cov109-Cylindrotheca_fusiformis.AAC.13